MTKAEQLRLVAFRSKFLEHAKRIDNVSATCRFFGISRQKFYKWKRRFDELGAAGLGDRPTRPHHSPNATPKAVVSKVLYLRQNYHFGAGRIRDYLKRFHSIRIAGQTVQNILRKHGLGRLPANQKHKPHGKRWQRYEKPQPGHRLQMDVKFLERIPGTKKRLYQFTAIDDCTRIRVLKIYDTCNQSTAVAFANEVIRRLPFRIHVVQTDNGAEFQSHFHWHLERLDIRHVYIKPWTPRLNGKVERSHRVDNEEFYQLLDKGGVSDDIHLFNKKLREWENYYNHHRPHGALGGKTPFERFLERAKVKVSRGSLLPTHRTRMPAAVSLTTSAISRYVATMARQQSLHLSTTWGGKRAGAGRPAKGPRPSEPHKTRAFLDRRHPVHVTARVAPDLQLRTRAMYHAVRYATYAAAVFGRFRIVHLSIQRDHIHLVVEASDRMSLARGMQSFEISAAKHINSSVSKQRGRRRRGTVFPDRYHARILKSPKFVRNALRYVLNNWRHHRLDRSDRARRWLVDPYSSGVAFTGWRELSHRDTMWKPPPGYDPLWVWLPKTWLLSRGWKRTGEISARDVPGPV